MNFDEVNRLVKRGLSVSTATAVVDGILNEEFEVKQKKIEIEAAQWVAIAANRKQPVEPRWDLERSRFYLCKDGCLPTKFDEKDFCVIDAKVEDVAAQLVSHSRRSTSPWSDDYVVKTQGIAYRWANQWPVTPPLISEFHGSVAMVGGLHRFHLARFYGVKCMPFLVQRSQLDGLVQLLQSARVRTG